MDELLAMGKQAGIKKLAKLERAGELYEYIKSIAPDFIDDDGEVMKFMLLDHLGWLF